MTRGRGIYDDETRSAAPETEETDPEVSERDTPDVDEGAGEPTA
ncbi:hypothetical protein [Mycolicibacterium sp. CR10]|nr:hypothetical protein [Mycolicibacterium sp. CR10]